MIALFSPIALRSIVAKNRVMISPMCQYSAKDGMSNDWHMAHLGRFAMGGAGIVCVEATAVSPEGRITHGDLGLWNDAQQLALAPIAAFLKSQGAVPAIQIAHAGRKASVRRPWEGGQSLAPGDTDPPWRTVGPGVDAFGPGWQTPHALDEKELDTLAQKFRDTAARAAKAQFELLELHFAHGYLAAEFLSAAVNRRSDHFGGSLENRMRFPLQIVEAVRSIWPADKPLSVRISAIDEGWSLEDSVIFARALKARGVDIIDCSSSGATLKRPVVPAPGYQVPFAERIRREAEIPTIAVGLITKPQQAEDIVASQKADIVAIAREALNDPNWPLHARGALSADPLDFSDWPVQVGGRLQDRERMRRQS